MSPLDWTRVEEILAGAISSDAAHRAAYLDAACAGDARLRAEVETLLAAHLAAAERHFSLRMAPEQGFEQLLRPISLVGQMLDRFLVERHLGAGGMGDVYQARDTRLDRSVALKVSAHPFHHRFEREARAIAALNHPNICTLHDVGPNFLVMELVEGPTLADRIARGPIPLDQALAIAFQIADAMEAAHEKGIVHRDLKPANVKVTPAGVVKVLDFGLAKAIPERDVPPSDDPSLSQAGMIIGTAAYMAPEQARGEPVDRRSDIWAFGVVLYEMLTGRQPFAGESTAEVLHAVATAPPDLPRLPDRLRPIVERCLMKDPAKRWRSIADVRFALEIPPPADPPPALFRRFRLAALAGALLAVAALVAGVWSERRSVPRPLMEFSVDLGPDAIAGPRIAAALSPDGSRLVFASRAPDGKTRLSVRRFDQTGSLALDGTEDGADPFFSPDGKWIGFFAGGKLKKISADGGAPVILCDALAPRGASWGPDGYIVVALRGRGGLSLVPEAGGSPQTLTVPQASDITHRWPQVLPGGKAVLYTAHTSAAQYDDARIEALSLPAGRRKTLLTGAYFGRYVPTGHLLFVRQGVLMAVPFDAARLELRGPAVPLLDDLASDSGTAAGQFDFSSNGTLVYLSRKGFQTHRLEWLDSSGRLEPLLTATGNYQSPKFSPDGAHLALADTIGKGPEIFSLDLARGALTRLTFSGQASLGPVWTPDGKHLAYYFSLAGGYAIGWIRSDGAGEPRILLQSRNFLVPYSFSPDGRRLAFYEQSPGTNRDLWTLPLDLTDPDDPKPAAPQPFLATPANELDPVFSPDGRWISYSSDESGRMELYVRPFPGPGGKWQISSGGGEYSYWSGRELFYEALDNRIMVTPFRVQGASFLPGTPRPWSNRQLLELTYSNLTLDPGGKRFAVITGQETAASLHLAFRLNFFDDLARRAPRSR